MEGRTFRISPFHSLRTQLCVGSIALLLITVVSISYFLIVHQKRILKHEIEKTVVFQGRNIALSSEKALLRSDPEFELFPLVKTILASSAGITSAVITDAEGIIYGARELQHLSKKYEMDVTDYERTPSDILLPDETLYQNDEVFSLRTPVRSLNKIVGYVHLSYSKQGLKDSMHRAFTITMIGSAVALSLGMILSLVLFRRISKPMGLLMEGVHRLGEGRLDTRISCPSRNEFRVLAESFNDMSTRIATAQEELVIKERMDHELEIAREIQGTLIPTRVHEPEGYQVAIFYQSATEVGGDYLDVIPLDRDNISLVMADVSGKGVPGLVVMGMLKIMVHSLVAQGLSPIQLIRELNVSLMKTLKPNMFVTFFIAKLNATTGRVVYSNAGHNPLVIYNRTKKRSEFHRMAGPPLGIFAASQFNTELSEYSIQMEPGSLILQYTDGLNESTNERGEQFSYERIVEICNEKASSGARSLIPHLIEAEQEFRCRSPQADDIALLALSAVAPVGIENFSGSGRGE
ncbi:MAG: SpoIIE family protein phosphatase [Candidatus Latescibacterota bacterium]|nr:MAG: SpoIIE family protein phosphatase [Candidatus Latescibacterota bacterium]